MIGNPSFFTRRSFLSSLTSAALATNDSLGQIARLQLFDALPETQPGEGSVEFASSDRKLVDGFHWAKARALDYVRESPVIGPWYEAALPGRNAFCMRDVSHMSTGAQFLGLGPRTRNMLRQFAEHISASKKWCTWWEITGEGKPAPVDYQSDQSFWYCLPANFDVMDACYRQWLWSRDNAYLDDIFLNFYRRTVTDYVKEWDHNHDGLLEHVPADGHMGIGTYDEDLTGDVLVGADLIAAQHAAYESYAAFELARNEQTVANHFAAKARDLKSLYNSKWWDASRNCYFGALGEDGQFHRDLKASTGGTNMQFPLYFGLTEGGPKTEASLDEIEKRLQMDSATLGGIVGGVEGRTYLPDIFYKYGRSRSGYAVLTALMNPALKRREYPEDVLHSHWKPGFRVDGYSSIFPARENRDLSSTHHRNRMGCPAPLTGRPQCDFRQAYAGGDHDFFKRIRTWTSFGGPAFPGKKDGASCGGQRSSGCRERNTGWRSR